MLRMFGHKISATMRPSHTNKISLLSVYLACTGTVHVRCAMCIENKGIREFIGERWSFSESRPIVHMRCAWQHHHKWTNDWTRTAHTHTHANGRSPKKIKIKINKIRAYAVHWNKAKEIIIIIIKYWPIISLFRLSLSLAFVSIKLITCTLHTVALAARGDRSEYIYYYVYLRVRTAHQWTNELFFGVS